MTTQIGWSFPSTNGGGEDGYNDSGIAHFTGTPLSSLARETIQNSLDAKLLDSDPVEVVFELKKIKPIDIGSDELVQAVAASRWQAESFGDLSASQALARAQSILGQREITCLYVSDRNTTGLREKNWHALIKMRGLSQKEGVEGAGGSYGIGKYAPFAVSSLRTVFYWTCYDWEGEPVEKFQGKAVLMSHDQDDFRTQGTGFYGTREGCSALTSQIPGFIRLRDSQGALVRGTALLVTGFNEERNWRLRIASSIIENYFYAIDQGSLRVMVEPGIATQPEDLEITDTTLGHWFDILDSTSNEESLDEDGSALNRARVYWELTDGSINPIERQDPDLGHCNLWIRVGEGLPSRVALVRRTGMLVTDEQNNLKRFPLHQAFAALCVFEDPSGNELLRMMENPQHNKFEPDRLPEEERAKGHRALRRITNWIRDEIRKQAGPQENDKTTVLSELAALLPDLQPDEPFDDSSQDGNEKARERGFGDRITLTLKPIRRISSALPKDEEEGGDGYGDDVGGSGGGGAGEGGEGGAGGPGEGEGEGGSGGQGGGAVRKLLPISGVRVLPVPGNSNRYRLSFRSHRNGTARLEIEEAGDSTTNPLEDIRAADGSTLAGLALVAGERTSLEINADNPIHERALRVAAIDENP